MATPRKHHPRPKRYKTTLSPAGHLCSASPKSGRMRVPDPPTSHKLGPSSDMIPNPTAPVFGQGGEWWKSALRPKSQNNGEAKQASSLRCNG
mmetsp:Transcript_26792/g.56771  ORF Transcript_26792/g.56771 Transcript_26792/m.56771 type:complete len:92 (-) Transcript_26792:128-403(-)